jgi:F-type H+-transporting ATPase subunit b
MSEIIAVFGIDWKLLLVQVVNFAVLLAILYRLLYKPFLSLIEKRRALISEGVADAERAKEAFRDAEAKKTDLLARASKEAEALFAQARKASAEKEAQVLKEAEEKSARLLTEARLKGEEIEREAAQKGKEVLAQLVVLGVARTLEQKERV